MIGSSCPAPHYSSYDKRKESDRRADMLIRNANEVLGRAAFSRTNTEGYDKIYALAKTLRGMVDVDVDPDMDGWTALNTLYRHLAQKDLSLMCFGSILQSFNGEPRYPPIPNSCNLPSWTGVSGLHSTRPIANITLDKSTHYTIDDNMRLRIKCRSYSIRLNKYNDYEVLLSFDTRVREAFENYHKVITSMDDFEGNESKALDWSQLCMLRAAGLYATHYHKPDDHTPFLSPMLPLSLTEECNDCVILGVIFDSVIGALVNDVITGYDHHYFSPVARKCSDDTSYRIIGVVFLKRFQHDELLISPQEYMDKMFDNLGCETQEFQIK